MENICSLLLVGKNNLKDKGRVERECARRQWLALVELAC